jgi:hypothetical protein
MAHVTSTAVQSPASSLDRTVSIAGDVGRRHSDTPAEHREIVRQLDAWCRSHDWPGFLNAHLAEEALRRS